MSDYRVSGRKGDWINVNDAIPDDGRKVLVADSGKGRVDIGTCTRAFGWWVNSAWACAHAVPTHWMPLPEPPEVER